jgi:hypothetical protein
MSTTEVTVRFLSDHPHAAMHDWLRLLNLLDPDMWNNLGVMPETIQLEVTSRWDDGLVDRLAEAMFHKTMVERLRGKSEPVPEWRDTHPNVRQSWLDAARCVVDGRPVDPNTGEPA